MDEINTLEENRLKLATLFLFAFILVVISNVISLSFLNPQLIIFSIILGIIGLVSLYFCYFKKNLFGIKLFFYLGTPYFYLANFILSDCIENYFFIPSIIIILSSLFLKIRYSLMIFIFHLFFIFLNISLGNIYYHSLRDESGDLIQHGSILLINITIYIMIITYSLNKWFLQSTSQLQEKNRDLEKAMDNIVSQEKIKSLQVIAGGLAHDFNNFLSIMEGKMLTSDVNNRDEWEKLKEEYEGIFKDGKKLTTKFLKLTKNSSSMKIIKNIGEIIENRTIMIFDSVEMEDFILHIDIDDNLWPIYGDKVQISQVIQNLVINAIDAMPKGGNITIEVSNVNENQEKCNFDSVIISVTDEGIGIKDEDKEKLFNLFFTTKKKGHGIGLSVSTKIVKDHGGVIGFESDVNKGSKFFFYLPKYGN